MHHALPCALCIFAIRRSFTNRRWGGGRSLLAYPPHHNMHLIDISVVLPAKTPPVWGAWSFGPSSIQRTLILCAGTLVFAHFSGRDYFTRTEVRIPPPSQRQSHFQYISHPQYALPFDIIAYMHSAKPTIHIYLCINVFLQSHMMLYSREVYWGIADPSVMSVSCVIIAIYIFAWAAGNSLT